jgi:hypothetical protein
VKNLDLVLFQNDWNNIVWILWMFLSFVMVFFYPRLMFTQIMWRFQQTVDLINQLSTNAKRIVNKKIAKYSKKEFKEAVNNFLEFFTIEPVSLDPYGIVKKIEHLTIQSEEKFKYFVRRIAPNMDSEEQANLIMGLSGAMSLYQIEKLIRHVLETMKKTKNYQLGLMLSMQLPLIEKISKALLKGTEALANGWPIGDGIGPLIVSNLAGNVIWKEIEEDVSAITKKIKGKNVVILKAKGPGGRLGRIGKAVDNLVKRNKIAKIITIDAAAKLEGEKTGSTAEGVGVAIGGVGVDRCYIENIATSKNIPLDTFVIKMGQEEAIMPMREEVLKTTGKIVRMIEENIKDTREKGKIIIVGVGNSSGIGNDFEQIKKAEVLIKKNAKILKQREDEEKKREKKSIMDWIGF